jgi:hypothetical protein
MALNRFYTVRASDSEERYDEVRVIVIEGDFMEIWFVHDQIHRLVCPKNVWQVTHRETPAIYPTSGARSICPA